ncbi:LysR family transcriptional regulator [Desulfosporosinus meridiei]|uniref:Transcriptional regulator n=1 Tax=Desulfosporosinus meridiei (strain ATCC BAA-275 / DSM 13257 / KCTC 12902 / NCIMB 13706 / S10) TaxID=768704 RepID=J7IQI0_DESMD|nr:LysR family transcriptional regulator [Desulfosporosinus meridiei]AFQ43865.1 transcriptional regulator [Desulfosporosinus meridiei DSM 13257]
MRIEQLQHVIEIDNKKSISKAAKTFFMSQPQLSHSVKTLETELGYKIFRRNKEGLIPTAQGKEVLKLAREIINNVEEMKTIGSREGDLAGNLSLTLEPAVFNAFASQLVKRFYNMYHNANLMITEDMPLSVIENVANGTCALGVTGWPDEQDETRKQLLDAQNIAYHDVLKDYFGLMVGDRHPLSQKEVITLRDLEDMTFVDYNGFTESYLRMFGIKPKKPSIIVYNREVLKSVIAANEGIAIFPRCFSFNDIYFQQGLIKIRGIEKVTDQVKMTMYLLYYRAGHLSPLTKQLIRMIIEITRENILRSLAYHAHRTV